jgi:hypothetical protein
MNMVQAKKHIPVDIVLVGVDKHIAQALRNTAAQLVILANQVDAGEYTVCPRCEHSTLVGVDIDGRYFLDIDMHFDPAKPKGTSEH